MSNQKLRYYRGNVNLLDANVKQEYTQEQINEIIKCSEDYEYFIYNYVYIKTKNGLEKPEIRDYQKRMLQAYHDHNRILTMAGRQCGKSVGIGMYVAWYICFHSYKTVGIVANKEKVAKLMLATIKNIFSNLPLYMKPGVEQWGTTEIQLDNKSIVTVAACSADALTGYVNNILIVDEVSKIPKNKANDFFDSVLPTVEADDNATVICCSCVIKDTHVFTDKGLRKVENFIEEDKKGFYEVEDYSVLGKDKIRSNNLMYNNGLAPTRKIRTSFGELECTRNHKLWACVNGEYGWYESEKLSVGDYIPLQTGMRVWGNDDSIPVDYTDYHCNTRHYDFGDTITTDLAYFLGLFVAEGYARKEKSQITLTCGDKIDHVFESLGLSYYKAKDNLHYNVNSQRLMNLIESLGFDINRKAKNKIIPDKLLSMSEENIIAFLQGFFDGDGTSHKTRGVVSCVSSSKELIDQIKYLLLNLGIVSSYFTGVTPPTKLVKVESVYHRIELDRINSKLFYDTIGFRLERKQNRRAIIDKLKLNRNSKDLIPYSGVYFKKFKTYSQELNKTLSYNANRLTSTNTHYNRTTVLRFKDVLLEYNDSTINDFLMNVDENIKWLPILDITESSNYTYDFSLPESNDFWCHSVIYNGIIGHQTPKGLNHWYKMWTEAEQGLSGYKTVRVEWDEVPGRDEEWKQKKIAEKGEEYFNQEYACQFIGSSSTLVDGNTLRTMAFKKPIQEQYDGKFKIYELPKKDHTYVLLCDVGEGIGKDYSTIQILDLSDKSYPQVAVFRDNEVKPFSYHIIIEKIGTYYNTGLAVIERNNCGAEVVNNLHYELDYENVYYQDEFGFRTTTKTKRIGCSNLKHLIESGKITLCDYDTISELSKFVYDGKTFKAQDYDGHDDLVMPLVMFAWIIMDRVESDLWFEIDYLTDVNKEKQEEVDDFLVLMDYDDL